MFLQPESQPAIHNTATQEKHLSHNTMQMVHLPEHIALTGGNVKEIQAMMCPDNLDGLGLVDTGAVHTQPSRYPSPYMAVPTVATTTPAIFSKHPVELPILAHRRTPVSLLAGDH